ncbi:unnamed protein product [Sphagnum jensenii]|uniref:Nucleotide-diphospho-sugar transferase domain-containing protein n=1 Tax=Sphagnum jensenii TaxID=128206 RepID=A0ABP0WMK0_9BRYO
MAGLMMLLLSHKATQLLPAVQKEERRNSELQHPGGNTEIRKSGITFYTAPVPFEGTESVRQKLAIHSWLRLKPCPNVVLMGRHPSIISFASSLQPHVSVDSDIEFTFMGTAMFHSMVARARASDSEIVVLLDPILVLLQDFSLTVNKMRTTSGNWLLVASPISTSIFPFDLQGPSELWVKAYAMETGQRLKCQGPRLWAWNTGKVPLHVGVMPPFVYGSGQHNEWLLTEALTFKLRTVVDASYSFSLLSPEHLTGQLQNGDGMAGRPWESSGNTLLALQYGSQYLRPLNASSIPLQLLSCQDSLRKAFCFYNTTDERHCRHIAIASESEAAGHCSPLTLRKDAFKSSELWVPFSLEALVARMASPDKVVVLSVVGNSYRDLLMSWVCGLHHLNISNFVVFALDDELYQFAVLQGLPVVKAAQSMNVNRDECHFGTECFQNVTKMKSRTVLHLLHLGYNVLFSDVDVYWFQNPMKEMMAYGPGTLVAQSDQHNDTDRANMPRKLNSGFYFAWSDKATIAAFEKIVKHALTSNMSEQPSFYDTMCGFNGVYAVGDDQCLSPETNVTVYFLDRKKYPNGASGGLWEKPNVREACIKQGCIVLHNNWTSSREYKLRRQRVAGLWEYDEKLRMCFRDWQGPNSRQLQ